MGVWIGGLIRWAPWNLDPRFSFDAKEKGEKKNLRVLGEHELIIDHFGKRKRKAE